MAWIRWPESDGLDHFSKLDVKSFQEMLHNQHLDLRQTYRFHKLRRHVTSSLSLLVLSTSLALCAWIIDNQEIFRTAVHCSRGWGEKKVGRNRRAELSPLYSHPVPCQPFQSRSSPFSRTIRIHFKTFKVKPYRVSCAVTRFLKFLNPSGFEVIIVLTPPETNAI